MLNWPYKQEVKPSLKVSTDRLFLEEKMCSAARIYNKFRMLSNQVNIVKYCKKKGL